MQVGRVVDGRLGILGQDGAFHNDGLFHELPVQPEACGSLDHSPGAGRAHRWREHHGQRLPWPRRLPDERRTPSGADGTA